MIFGDEHVGAVRPKRSLAPLLTLLVGPVLLGLPPGGFPDASADKEPWRGLPPHRDEDQVKVDVDRAFVYYPNRTYLPSCSPTPAEPPSPPYPLSMMERVSWIIGGRKPVAYLLAATQTRIEQRRSGKRMSSMISSWRS